jgi:hypothetical protein
MGWLGGYGACYEVAMTRVRHRSSLSFATLFALCVLWFGPALACTSPTLPLPPPDAPVISAGVDLDHFKLTSTKGAEPNALVIIVNRREDLARDQRVTGTLADGDGSWDAIVVAKTGDVLDVSQESGSTLSAGTTVTVE